MNAQRAMRHIGVIISAWSYLNTFCGLTKTPCSAVGARLCLCFYICHEECRVAGWRGCKTGMLQGMTAVEIRGGGSKIRQTIPAMDLGVWCQTLQVSAFHYAWTSQLTF